MSVTEILSLAAADAAALAGLHGRCFPDEPWDAAAFAGLLATPGTRALGLALGLAGDGGLTGLVLLRTAAEESEILSIGVAPDARGRRLGSGLLAAAIAAARADGATALFLEAAADNDAALALYRRFGLTEVGRRRGYYRRGDRRIDALVMTRGLTENAPDSFANP